MNESEYLNSARDLQLAVTASTPVELVQAGLRAVLDLIRAGRPPGGASGTVAIPVHGSGPNLPQLFLDLTDDLISQVEEFGTDLDQIALDGLLQTDTGGYTAWGYLTGVVGEGATVQMALVAGSVVVLPQVEGLTLTCQLRTDAE